MSQEKRYMFFYTEKATGEIVMIRGVRKPIQRKSSYIVNVWDNEKKMWGMANFPEIWFKNISKNYQYIGKLQETKDVK